MLFRHSLQPHHHQSLLLTNDTISPFTHFRMSRWPLFPSQTFSRFDAGFPFQHHCLYELYARHFRPVAVPLFLDTYSQVHESTKAKIIEMLATWRAGTPNGRELFDAVPQLAIEQELFGTSTSSVRSFGDHRPSLVTIGVQDTTPVSSAQVLGVLQFSIGQAECETQSNPYNNTVRNQLPVLYQVGLDFYLFSCDRGTNVIF